MHVKQPMPPTEPLPSHPEPADPVPALLGAFGRACGVWRKRDGFNVMLKRMGRGGRATGGARGDVE
eukprot:3784387-Rhodomonas_salina.1